MIAMVILLVTSSILSSLAKVLGHQKLSTLGETGNSKKLVSPKVDNFGGPELLLMIISSILNGRSDK